MPTTSSVTTETTIATDHNETGTVQNTTHVPIRTTKALLLSVTVPRIHRVYISPPKQWTTNPNDASSTAAAAAAAPTTTTKKEDDILVVDPNNTDIDKKQGQQRTNDKNEDTCINGDKAESKKQSKKQEQQKETVEPSTVDKDKKNTNSKGNNKDDEDNNDEKSDTSQQQMGGGKVTSATSTPSPSTETNATTDDDAVVIDGNKEAGDGDSGSDSEEEHVVVGYIENDNDVDGSKDAEVLDVVTAEELATVVKLDENSPSTSENDNIHNNQDSGSVEGDSEKKGETADSSSSPTKQTQQQDEEPQPPNNNNNPINALKNMVFAVMKFEEEPIMLDQEQTLQALSFSSSIIPPFDDNNNFDDDIPQMVETDDNNKEIPPQATPPPAESTAAPPKPNTEIKMEALVRMTFRNLFNEGHFFNNPLYAHKMDSSQQQQKQQTQLITTMQHAEYRWVQVEVMVKEMSIGLILERLDRIGVGSLVGTLAIFKSELCQTASVDEQAAVANTACAGAAATATTAAATTTTTTTTTVPKKVDNANTMSIRSAASNVVAAAVSTLNPSIFNTNNNNNKERSKVGFVKKNSSISASTTNTTIKIDDPPKEKQTQEEGGGAESNHSTMQIEKEVQDEEDRQNKAAAAAARAEWKAAASRLRVEQVKEQIQEQAKLSFDFLALLTIASILSGIGLIVNSTVVIVASMLVSPIMGPVMGMTFGSRVLDWKLARSSFVVELIALLSAIGIGVLIGIGSSWSPIAQEWPTEEMSSRGSVVGLLTGVAIAIPSGMGVALSILGNHTASLVGVAISASLLPPAVNAGICWTHAVLIRSGAITKDENYGDEEENFGFIGGISFALTIVNIVCIWASGMLMFAMKEVTPSSNQKQSASAFWSRDITVARAIQRGNQTVDMDVIKDGIQKELQVRREEGKPFVPPMVPASMALASGGGAIPPKTNSKQKKNLLVEVDKEEENESVRYVGLQAAAQFLGYEEEDNIEAAEKKVDAEEANDTSNEGVWGVVGRWFQ